jgi:hypothetical protein
VQVHSVFATAPSKRLPPPACKYQYAKRACHYLQSVLETLNFSDRTNEYFHFYLLVLHSTSLQDRPCQKPYGQRLLSDPSNNSFLLANLQTQGVSWPSLGRSTLSPLVTPNLTLSFSFSYLAHVSVGLRLHPAFYSPGPSPRDLCHSQGLK